MAVKILTVATEVQKAVLEKVVLQEIASGFWKNTRPADHAESWKGVEIKVGNSFGASGNFEIPRNYNLVNPDFFHKAGDRMLKAAQEVDPNITEKGLKKQLITLNQIIGGRLKEQGGTAVKENRGRKPAEATAEAKPKTSKATTVKRAAVVHAETDEPSTAG
jgi:hypothetical protein